MMKKRMTTMLLWTLLLPLIASVLGAGCRGGANGALSPDTTVLSAEELAYFSGDQFFNGGYMNIRNQFLSSLYDQPADIDLFGLFYVGSGKEEAASDEEREALIANQGWDTEPDCHLEKISREAMEGVLSQYMGLTLADTAKAGLDNFIYLEQYDAYYFYHGDTNYRSLIVFDGGEKHEDLVRLYYEDTFLGDGKKVLTLQEQDGDFLFVANQLIGELDLT